MTYLSDISTDSDDPDDYEAFQRDAILALEAFQLECKRSGEDPPIDDPWVSIKGDSDPWKGTPTWPCRCCEPLGQVCLCCELEPSPPRPTIRGKIYSLLARFIKKIKR